MDYKTKEWDKYSFFNFEALQRMFFFPESCIRNKQKYRLAYGLAPRDSFTEAIEEQIDRWFCGNKCQTKGKAIRDMLYYSLKMFPKYFDSSDQIMDFVKD